MSSLVSKHPYIHKSIQKSSKVSQYPVHEEQLWQTVLGTTRSNTAKLMKNTIAGPALYLLNSVQVFQSPAG